MTIRRSIGSAASAALLLIGSAIAAALLRLAQRSKISVRASIINALVSHFAPDQNAPGAFEQMIQDNRKAGPEPPSKKLLKNFRFEDVWIGSDRVFRLSPQRKGRERLRFLYLHGGAYLFEVQAVQWNVIAGLLKRVPAEVIAPVYPLAPEQCWQEGLAAVERIYASAVDEVGSENVVFVGDSAGGGLALALAQQLRNRGAALPAALVLFSPWLDIGVSGEDQPAIQQRDPALKIEFLRRAGKLWARDLPLDDPRVSPLFGRHEDLPPTIVFSGSRDVLDSDALRLAAANSSVVHCHYPEMIHVWPAAPIPEGKQAFDEAAAFIRAHIISLPK